MDRSTQVVRWTLELPVGVCPVSNKKLSSQSKPSLTVPLSQLQRRPTRSIRRRQSDGCTTPLLRQPKGSIRRRQSDGCTTVDRVRKVMDISNLNSITSIEPPSPSSLIYKSPTPTQRSRLISPSTKGIQRKKLPKIPQVKPVRNSFHNDDLKKMVTHLPLCVRPDELKGIDSTCIGHNLELSKKHECGQSTRKFTETDDNTVTSGPRRRSVTFSPVRRIKKVTHINDLKKITDLKRLWFSPEELNAIDSDSREIIDRIKKGVQLNEEQECVRGLEKLIQKEQAKRNSRRSNAIKAVLDEQKMQKEWGIQDEEYLADLYQEFTYDSQHTASLAGLQDGTESFL